MAKFIDFITEILAGDYGLDVVGYGKDSNGDFKEFKVTIGGEQYVIDEQVATKLDTLIDKDFAMETTLEEARALLELIKDKNFLTGNIVAEQLDETDAVSEVLTFSANIESIEIYHEEATLQDFIVNGLTLTLASGGWRSPIAGTPSSEVTIPAGISCIITRLV